jgi:PPM family protein phosphatase
MILRFGACTDVGRRRQTNEDSYVAEPDLGLFAVADGMGGHAGGEVASQTVIEGMIDFIRHTQADKDITWPFGFEPSLSYSANRLRTAILAANRRLSRRIEGHDNLRGTGSTLAAVLLDGDAIAIANVGDCRVYRIRNGAIARITRDHSWVAEQVRAGYITEDEARVHPMRHVVTQAVSGDASVGADLLETPVQPGDRFLLCSDGVHGQVGDAELLRIVQESADEATACRAVVDAANAHGGPDNSTVVLVSVTELADRLEAADDMSDTIRLMSPGGPAGRKPDPAI